MFHKFDLFEKFPDGSSLWRACVIGREDARHHLMELAKTSTNQFYAIDIESGKIVDYNLDPVGMNHTVPHKVGRTSKSAVA